MLKKLSIGMCFTAAAAVCAIISLIVYAVNVNGEGYFQNATVSNLVLYCVLAALALIAAIALNLFVEVPEGPAQLGVNLVTGALQIVAPMLLAMCLINLIVGRAEGLGFIYFSNADVILEVQTPANMASASGAIANMVVLGISTVVGIVASFINVKKKSA